MGDIAVISGLLGVSASALIARAEDLALGRPGWKPNELVGTEDFTLLRERLSGNQARRVSRRWFLRWRRRQLLRRIIVVERELVDAPADRVAQLNAKADRIAEMLAKNARRLFR